MERIWKYALDPIADAWMPVGAKILSAGEQSGSIMVWALVDPDLPLRSRAVRAAPTGTQPPEGEFVGTVQMADGLVFHVFDCGELPRRGGGA